MIRCRSRPHLKCFPLCVCTMSEWKEGEERERVCVYVRLYVCERERVCMWVCVCECVYACLRKRVRTWYTCVLCVCVCGERYRDRRERERKGTEEKGIKALFRVCCIRVWIEMLTSSRIRTHLVPKLDKKYVGSLIRVECVCVCVCVYIYMCVCVCVCFRSS